MGTENKGSLGASCLSICWLVAILLGLLVVAVLVNWANWPMVIVLVLGLITVVGAGWVLPNYFCQVQDDENDVVADSVTAVDILTTVEAKAASEVVKAAADTKNTGVVDNAKPATLSAARDGKADDLKMIKGIGPKMENMCNEMGFYHFDQVAAWSVDEIAWVDANLKGFKGRVTRDDWVAQAKLLAAGGETDFSKRVEDGDVY